MKLKIASSFLGCLSLAALCAPLHATEFPGGITFGTTFGLYRDTFTGFQDDFIMNALDGGIYLQSGYGDSYTDIKDGGINLLGSPTRIFLGSFNEAPFNTSPYTGGGVFEVNSWDRYLSSNVPPLFRVDSGTDTADFNNVDVEINDGTLKIDGNPVATQAGIPSLLGTLGSVALGTGSSATGTGAAALSGGTGSGDAAVSLGSGTIASSYASVALGLFNMNPSGDNDSWVGTDNLFSLGNGTDNTHRSDAVTVQKTGKTTLTNKAWSNVDPLADPAGSSDEGGEALEVNGHTILNGKVIISEPQGDISMGIYE